MVPATFGGKALQSMTRDGATLPFTRETIKGVEYAMFAASAGAFTATYGADTPAPSITAVSAVAQQNGTATVTWTTDEAADSRVDYGTSASPLNLNVTDPARVTSHSMQLSGLTPGTTYHFRVTSADSVGNSTTSPAAAGAPATFTVPTAPVSVTAFPNTTTIEPGLGTARGGNAASLTANDNNYFEVNSTTSGTRTTSWYGSFTGVPSTLSQLTVSYLGRNSASCTQVISIWRWTDGTWVQLNSSSVGNTETARNNLAPTGAAGNYAARPARSGCACAARGRRTSSPPASSCRSPTCGRDLTRAGR